MSTLSGAYFYLIFLPLITLVTERSETETENGNGVESNAFTNSQVKDRPKRFLNELRLAMNPSSHNFSNKEDFNRFTLDVNADEVVKLSH